jgi:hypothetical protein
MKLISSTPSLKVALPLLALTFGLSQPAIAQVKAPFVVKTNHTLTTGTYLGGNGEDQARGVVFSATGEPIVGGNFANLQTMGQVRQLAPGTTAEQPGKIMRLTNDGKPSIETTLGNRIDDMSITPGGNRLVVSGDFGIAMVDPATLKVLWQNPLTGIPAGNGSSDGGQTRVAIDGSWRVVVLRGGVVQTFAPDGKALNSVKIDRTFVNDVAIDKATNRIYVTGFSNRKNAGVPVQVPFLYALNRETLQESWRTWDFNPTTLGKDMADSRMYRVVLGPKGEPIVLGESAGGNSVFRWNGVDLSTETRVKLDMFSDTYNSKSNHMVYFAKIDPATGKVIAGQYAIPRNDTKNNQANTIRAKDCGIDVDGKGNVYISSLSAYQIANRNQNVISGQPVAPYTGDDFTFMMVTPDFKQRLRWTSFAALPKGGGVPNAIAARNGKVAIFGTVTFGGMITLPGAVAPQPFNPEADNIRDAYLGVLKVY